MDKKCLAPQIESLWKASLETAPVLRPLPDLTSLLRRRATFDHRGDNADRTSTPAFNILDICTELFKQKSEVFVNQWKDIATRDLNNVCSVCYEHLEDADKADLEQCLVPDYEFDLDRQTIILNQLKVRLIAKLGVAACSRHAPWLFAFSSPA